MSHEIYFSKVIVNEEKFDKFQEDKAFLDFWDKTIYTEEELRVKHSKDIEEYDSFDDFRSDYDYLTNDEFLEIRYSDWCCHRLDKNTILIVFAQYS